MINFKDIEIRLTLSLIASIFDMLIDGPTVFSKNWYSVLNLNKKEVLTDLICSTPQQKGSSF